MNPMILAAVAVVVVIIIVIVIAVVLSKNNNGNNVPPAPAPLPAPVPSPSPSPEPSLPPVPVPYGTYETMDMSGRTTYPRMSDGTFGTAIPNKNVSMSSLIHQEQYPLEQDCFDACLSRDNCTAVSLWEQNDGYGCNLGRSMD